MTSLTLEEIEPVIRAAWSEQTCDPVDLPWSPANPSRGQCAVTAFVLHDLLGGDLLSAEVLNADGSSQGWHTWNRLPDGTEVDLTAEQFAPDEVLQQPVTFQREPGPPDPCAKQYDVLRSRVIATLEKAGHLQPPPPNQQ
jgi:hypothetical protein